MASSALMLFLFFFFVTNKNVNDALLTFFTDMSPVFLESQHQLVALKLH